MPTGSRNHRNFAHFHHPHVSLTPGSRFCSITDPDVSHSHKCRFIRDAFWLVRGEIGDRNTGARTVLFGDIGWAGQRADWNRPGRPLSGVGIGQSFLDGLIRIDLARGLWPAKQWRLDLHLDAKF